MSEECEEGGRRDVLALGWPLAVGMLSFTLMGVVDTLLMARVGTAALAGVGLGASLYYSCQAFFRGLTRGAQSLVSAADGADDRERVSRSASAALWLGLLSGFGAAALLACAYPVVLAAVVNDAEVAERCSRYLSVRVWGLPFSLVGYGALAALQGVGKTRVRMWVSVVGCSLNVVLDLVLIFGWGPLPAMGEVGAALATVFSQGLMVTLFLWRFVVVFGCPRWPGVAVLRSALSVGVPDGAQCQVCVLAMTTVNLVVARSGAEHLAASQVAFQLISVSFLPGMGLSEAACVLVGRYLGAERPQAAARSVRSARELALVLFGACALLFALGGHWLASWFTEDEGVIALAASLLKFAAAFQLLDAVAMVHLCALRGAGDTRFTFVLTSVCAWALLVPCTVLFGLVLGWGAQGAWLGLLLEIGALAAFSAWRVRGIARGEVGRLDLLLGKSA